MEYGLVTVVVPVYKTEKYLERCMESIVNQSYRKLEIILVDDGSPDSCPQLCENWVQKDSRIKVVHKANAGLGMARNTGIDCAKGEYICFCDSDDYIALDTISNAVELACRDQADLVLYGLNMVGADGKILKACPPSTDKTCYRDTEILEFILPNMIEGSSKVGQNFNLNMSSCACLFSMKLIRESNWRFVSEREYISEDYYSLLKLYNYVRTVSVLKQACYYYCYNESSLTHVFRPDRYERVCHCYRAMLKIAQQLKYPAEIERSLSVQFFGNAVGAMKQAALAGDAGFAQKLRCLRRIIRDDTLRYGLQMMDISSETTGRKLLIATIKTQCALPVYLLIMAKEKAAG